MKDDLTPEEVNGHVIDIVTGGVDTVRYLSLKAALAKKSTHSITWQFTTIKNHSKAD